MDVLSDILGALRLRSTFYFSTQCRPPWGVRVPAYRRVARFHLIARGSCWVRVTGAAEPVHLESGDLVLVPHGTEHHIADAPDTPCRPVDEVVRDAGFSGEGPLILGDGTSAGPTRLVCGHFEFDSGLEHPLLSALPSTLVAMRDDRTGDGMLEDTFALIVREVQQGRPGHEAVVRRLSEVLFVLLVRLWARRDAQDHGIVAALADPQLARALAAIHAQPAAPWSVESLGQAAGMGRTAFAERFRSVVGQTPKQYVTGWRIQRARQLLSESRLSIDQVAEQAGYESAASFSRVFKRVTGTSPGGYRDHRRVTMSGPAPQ
jgi:AraC-like DNA-binding protein